MLNPSNSTFNIELLSDQHIFVNSLQDHYFIKQGHDHHKTITKNYSILLEQILPKCIIRRNLMHVNVTLRLYGESNWQIYNYMYEVFINAVTVKELAF